MNIFELINLNKSRNNINFEYNNNIKMGRRSSRRSSYSRSSSPRAQPYTSPTRQTGPQPRSHVGMMPGVMGSLVSGMAFGAGSEVAHQAVRSSMNHQ